MTEALEEYIMKSVKTGPEEKPVINPMDISDLIRIQAMNKTLPLLYDSWCKLNKTSVEPSVMRLFEGDNFETLDLSTLTLRPDAFRRIAEICLLLPLVNLNLEATNPKPDHIQILAEMAIEHPTLERISLAQNPSLGFSAARILLPLIKQNKRIVGLDVEGTCMAAPTRELIDSVLERNAKWLAEEKLREVCRFIWWLF